MSRTSMLCLIGYAIASRIIVDATGAGEAEQMLAVFLACPLSWGLVMCDRSDGI
jgi:hypothetical protein